MRLDTGQQMRLDQRMKLAPRMIQSMEILQMSAMALEERIAQELASNPTLELREPGTDASELAEEIKQEQRDAVEGERELVVTREDVDKNHADDFERLSNLSEEYKDSWASNDFETGESYRKPRYDGERDAKIDAMANAPARGQSLSEQLLADWHLLDLPQVILQAGEFLIGFIDDDGYLRTEKETLLDQLPPHLTEQNLDDALTAIHQNLEPVGIGARDLQECLLLQIDARIEQLGRTDNANGKLDALEVQRLLVSDYLKDIEGNRLPKIAKSANLTIDEVKQGILGLRQFYPHPGRLLVEAATHTITPDAIIEYDEDHDQYVAYLTNGQGPSIQINDSYSQMSKDKTVDRKTRDFVNNNLRSASWLLDAIQQRQNTLLRVINVVLAAQRDFFDQGNEALKPLPMTTVADQLGIHVATVSRAVSEKHIQSPRGIFPLRMFFSGGTETEDGESMSWTAVQAKLKTIVDEEDKSKPLSDDALVEKLKAEGIEIARRTVAKYRKQMNIPTARQRREY